MNKNKLILLFIIIICILFIICYTFNFIYNNNEDVFNKYYEEHNLCVNIVILLIPLLLLIFLAIRYSTFINKIKHQLILAFIVFLIFIVFTGHIYHTGWKEFFEEFNLKEKPFYLVNIAIALAAIATATFTWWKNNINQRISFSQECSRQDKLFVQAISSLNEDSDLLTRKGCVHVLKDLAKTSPEQAHRCIDILCSLNESWMQFMLENRPNIFEKFQDNFKFTDLKNIKIGTLQKKITKNKLFENIILSKLVLQSLSEIFKHISENSNFKGTFNLSNKYLCAINLKNIDFKDKFDFSNSSLQYADIENVNFSNAILSKTDFRNAKNIELAKFDDNRKFAIFTDEDYKRLYNGNN